MTKNDNYQLKILIIDDNQDDYETMKRAAKKINFPCDLHWCDSGDDGVEFLKNCTKNKQSLPNIIFLDINMPGLDGKQTLKILKDHEELRMIPVLMFTTSSNEADIKDCYGLGANSYIQKPHSYQDLMEIFDVIDKYWMNVSSLPTIE